MTGKTNSGSRSSYGDIYEFEYNDATGAWVNTNIPIADVRKILLQYHSTPNLNLYGTIAELDTVTDDVLTMLYVLSSAAGGYTGNTSLKVQDGMIYFKAQNVSQLPIQVNMTLVR